MTVATDLAFALLFGASPAGESVRLEKAVCAIPFAKVDDEQRIVRGVVLLSCSQTFCEADSQGDVMTTAEVEKAAHGYMVGLQRGDAHIGVDHEAPADAAVIESFIAPVDFEEGGQLVRKGSWFMAMKIHDDELWQSVKDGTRTAFSVGGRAERTQIA